MWRTVAPILGRAVLGIVEWLAHTCVVLVVLLTIWAVERVLTLLWEEDRLLFGRWHLSHLFDAFDLAVLAALLALGGWALVRRLSREHP